jgi:peptidylprolyl isomerase
MADLLRLAAWIRMPQPMARTLLLVALVSALGLVACGAEADEASPGGDGATSESASGRGLEDTSTKPSIPKPTGTPPRRLRVEDIVKGRGAPAKAGDTVVVHYVGVNFSNGREFDASWDAGSPFPLQLGEDQVIEGWDRGLVGIREGGRRMLTIPPELGYGAQGYPPDIPPNETLVLVVDAVEVAKP